MKIYKIQKMQMETQSAWAHRVEKVLVEATLPAESVELAEEAVAAVHVLHRAQLRLPGLRQPGLPVPARAHELLGLAQAVQQAGHEARHLRARVLQRRARARKQPLHQLEHAVVCLCLHAPCGGNTQRGARAESTASRDDAGVRVFKAMQIRNQNDRASCRRVDPWMVLKDAYEIREAGMFLCEAWPQSRSERSLDRTSSGIVHSDVVVSG